MESLVHKLYSIDTLAAATGLCRIINYTESPKFKSLLIKLPANTGRMLAISALSISYLFVALMKNANAKSTSQLLLRYSFPPPPKVHIQYT